MKKKLYRIILILSILTLLLSACGRKEQAFQGTITDITDHTVTITPDPGAAILDKAASVCFDASELEDLQAKPGDSVYVTYTKVRTRDDVTTIQATAWQMMIRAPHTEAGAASIWQGGQETTVTGEDGTFLTDAIANADWVNEAMALEPLFGIRTTDGNFGLDLFFSDCIWQCTLLDDNRCATIKGADAYRIASIYQANGFTVPNWQEVETASGTKTTTAGLNLRNLPGTDSTVITSVGAGTELTVTGKTDGWYQVIYQDMTLYGSAEYLN